MRCSPTPSNGVVLVSTVDSGSKRERASDTWMIAQTTKHGTCKVLDVQKESGMVPSLNFNLELEEADLLAYVSCL